MAKTKPTSASTAKSPATKAKATTSVKEKTTTSTTKAKTVSEKKPTTKKVEKKIITREDIERRAYEIYLENGCIQGSEIHNWLQAEKELLGL